MTASNSPNLQELVQNAQKGDQTAFRQLYRLFLPKIYGYVASRVGQQQEAEDITSTIFMKTVEHLNTFKYRGQGSFAAWIFTIARNELKQYYRRSRQVSPLPPDFAISPKIEDNLQQLDNLHIVQNILHSLSERRAEVIRLRYFSGLRNKEIAVLLNLDERTIAAHISRALDDIRSALAGIEITEKEK